MRIQDRRMEAGGVGEEGGREDSETQRKQMVMRRIQEVMKDKHMEQGLLPLYCHFLYIYL